MLKLEGKKVETDKKNMSRNFFFFFFVKKLFYEGKEEVG